MKRGNTALKRGVAIAAAFTTAIAGAVLAAPAASAAPTATDAVRVIPVADSGWTNADGSVADAATAGSYGASHATNAPTVLNYNSSYQGVRGLQIALPSAAAADISGWAGATVTIALAGGDATFASAPTKINLGKNSVAAAAFDTVAGVVNSAHSTNFLDTAGVLASTTIVKSGAGLGLNTAKTEYTFQLPATTATGSGATDVFVLSVEGISVNIPKDFSAASDSPVVTASVTIGAAASGTTTLGVVNAYAISADGDTVATSGTTTLPKITVTELVKDAFSAGDVTLAVTGTEASSGSFTVSFADAKTKSNNASLTAADPTGAGLVALTPGLNSEDRVESFTVSGIKVTGAKAGTDITVSVVNGASSVNENGAGTASAVSFVADLASLTSVKLTPTTALPRLAGANRYATAADIATTLGASDAVVIANGEDNKEGIDALAANYLAAAAGAPILLTSANTLPKETEDALTELFKASAQDITVYVMGKTDTVSAAVRSKIESTIKATISNLGSVKIKEIAGSDRYETSAKAAAEGEDLSGVGQFDLGKGSLRTAFLASGQANADALAAGAVSAAAGVPVLLTTNGDALPASVDAAISSLHISQVVILGSTDRVSAKVADALSAAGVNVVRLAGTGAYGRYDTAVKIAELGSETATDGFGTNGASLGYLANGNGGFADALAIGPLAGNGGNVVLTVPNGSVLPPNVAVFLKNSSTVGSVQAVGGKDRVSDAIVSAAEALVS